MGHIKNIFKIILVIQLVTCALATYGHPDAETIDFGSPTQPSRDQFIIEAAIKRGMDGEAVAELLRTKTPVVRTTTTPAGFTKTTTYKLEPDGSISSKSILQKRNRYVYNSGSIPDNIPLDDLNKSPTGTITRTFTDSDGNKVTQTIAVSKPKTTTTTVADEDDLSGDWFSNPEPEYQPPTRTVHRTVTRTFTGPTGERRTVSYWPSNNTPLYTGPYGRPGEAPPGFTTVNHKPKYPPIGNIDWPTFDEPSFSDPWDTSNPEDGWEEVKPEIETTTEKKKLESWTPKTWDWPEFPTHPTTTSTTTTSRTTIPTTTVKPTLYIEPEPTTRKPLPNLEDFLKSQYGPSTPQTKPKVTTITPKNSSPTSSTPKVIQLEDLPVTEILVNGQPADEKVIKQLPPHLTPQTRPPTDKIMKVEHKHPIDDDVELYTPKIDQLVRTYSKTHTGPNKPTLQDLDPQMQEVLKRAGIKPEDITNIDGDTITKTRTEPDGRVITTTYKVNSVPVLTPIQHTPVQHTPVQYTPVQLTPVQTHYTSHSLNSYKPLGSPLTPLQPYAPHHLSPISEFLAQLGLTKFDITSRNGHYSKTFIDENGDVLTATFVLSSPKGVGKSEERPHPKPQK